MKSGYRTSLAAGLMLILLGSWFLAVQLVPGIEGWLEANFDWPLAIVSVGVLLLIFGILGGIPAMAIPACIVGGIGGMLYWQNATGNWESWSYAWSLIIGFVGVGIILAGLLGQDTRRSLRSGGELVFISLVLFAIFGSISGAMGFVGDYWPALLILLGLLILIRALLPRRRRSSDAHDAE